LAILTQTKGNFAEKVIITLVFKKNAIFFAENWQKSQKIVIITSVPGWAIFWSTFKTPSGHPVFEPFSQDAAETKVWCESHRRWHEKEKSEKRRCHEKGVCEKACT
jgi:hypothetical protein